MSFDTDEKEKRLVQKIARVFDETRGSNATHQRKLKDLSALRFSSSLGFFEAFSRVLIPLFNFQRRIASAERVVRFVSIFASTRDCNDAAVSDAFLEEFLRFLLIAAGSANKSARFRACQIISEIIMRLPDDAEVSSDIWDEVIECIKLRVGDKVPAIRTFAVRALSRFANDSENSDILELLLQTLPSESNADVRKAIILSLPPSAATSSAIIGCTLDVSESVRKATYCVLSSKFPLQSLSIKHRTIIVQRGLADRSAAVMNECIKLVNDEWLEKGCNGDPIEFLKYLDVETYESVAVSVMGALLKAGFVKVHDGHSIQEFIRSTSGKAKGPCTPGIQLMEPEFALYWRTVCKHLQTEAQAKGSDAAMTTGTEAAVYAAEASDSNDLLERILPVAISEYVELVKAHIVAGSNYHFATRQLLLLGEMLDFSDTTNRKIAGEFVQELLHKVLDHELDDNGNEVVIGDGISLGGDRDWANAVSGLARRVHAAPGEFEEVVLGVVEELAQPCRERTANCLQWMHCLAVTGLLLEKTKSFRWMQGKAIEPAEILWSLLLPGAKHVRLDVQKAAIRCLGLFGLVEKEPSEDVVKQLRLSFVKGPSLVSTMACKALLDLGMWHGLEQVDKAMNRDLSSPLRDCSLVSHPINLGKAGEDLDIELLDLLYAGFEQYVRDEYEEVDDNESIQAILGEGFAKILLLSENYPSIPASCHSLLLVKIISLYFCSELNEFQRLKQCLSVFFEHYPCLSVNHKKCLSKAFVHVMRSMWPGVNGNTSASKIMVSNMRKRAVQASRFMLQMMQAPCYAKKPELRDENISGDLDCSTDPLHDFESGEEGLGIRLAAEVASFHTKKTAAEKAYVSALCRILVSLHFRESEQEAIKLMRQLLINHVAASVSLEKELVKDLKHMAEHLKSLDRYPDQELLPDLANLILGRLGLELILEVAEPTEIATPAVRSTRPARGRRRARNEDESSSDSDISPTSVVPTNPVMMMSTRSQRASKAAAMSRMTTASKSVRIRDDEDEDDKSSELTSEDDSDESYQSD